MLYCVILYTERGVDMYYAIFYRLLDLDGHGCLMAKVIKGENPCKELVSTILLKSKRPDKDPLTIKTFNTETAACTYCKRWGSKWEKKITFNEQTIRVIKIGTGPLMYMVSSQKEKKKDKNKQAKRA